jgi:hypothetical protein
MPLSVTSAPTASVSSASPAYYYNNYPDYYEPYPVVETPVYVTRIQEYYPEPIFVRTYQPIVTNIKIKSKYKDKSIDKIYAKLAKPTREQINFKKNNPNRPQFVEFKKGKVKDVPPKFKEVRERNRNNIEKRGKGNDKNFEARNKPNKAERRNVKTEKPNRNFERRNEKPDKVERRNEKPNKVQQQNVKPNKADKPGKGNDKNRGGGNGKGNGGGKGKGKG